FAAPAAAIAQDAESFAAPATTITRDAEPFAAPAATGDLPRSGWQRIRTNGTLAIRLPDQIANHLCRGRPEHDCSCCHSRRAKEGAAAGADRHHPGRRPLSR